MAKQGFICLRSKVGVMLALHVPWFVLCVLVEGTCYSLVSFGIHHSTSMSKVFNGQIQTFVVFNFGWSQKRLYYCFNGNFLCWSSYNNINICCIQKQQYKLPFKLKCSYLLKVPIGRTVLKNAHTWTNLHCSCIDYVKSIDIHHLFVLFLLRLLITDILLCGFPVCDW